MIKVRTISAEETRAIGAAVAQRSEAGDVILLAGDLGAGKTTFAQGVGRALGVAEPVTSPTFTLVRTYNGERLRLHHVDLYRVDALEEVFDLGLGELFDDESVALVEWGDLAEATLTADYLEVRIEFGAAADERLIGLRAAGLRWNARIPGLTAAIEALAS